nr:PREDICTED: uncharacterized protein LOC109033376 isoform X2 [Bemisia tabaci]
MCVGQWLSVKLSCSSSNLATANCLPIDCHKLNLKESKATKAPAEKEHANPATTPGLESPLPTTEHLRKESSTQTTLPNLPEALENDSTALVNQLIPFDEEIVDVVAKKFIKSKCDSWRLADTIIQKAINDPECSIACAALSRKLTRDFDHRFQTFLEECCSEKFDFFNWKPNKTSCKDNDNNSLRAKLRTKLASLPEGEDEKIVKMKQMRLYRFFGHLFLQYMLSYEFMDKVFFYLLRQRRDIYIETLCALLSSIGKQHSIQTSRYNKPEYALDPIMEELYKLVESNDGNATNDQKLSPKCVNSMLLVLKKWSNDWN